MDNRRYLLACDSSVYLPTQTVVVAQLVRAPDCGSGGRGFETHLPPNVKNPTGMWVFSFQPLTLRGFGVEIYL
jgi:hypothetical protein